MEDTNSNETTVCCEKSYPQHIQFEIVEEELLDIDRPTVQVYIQS